MKTMTKNNWRLTSIWTLAVILLPAMFSNARSATAAGEPAAGTATEMDRILAATFHSDAPGAAVLVVQNGAVKLRQGYGLADLEHRVPMDPGAVFPICSLTKQFTAVAILQLVEAGKLKLTDDPGRFVPDYPTGDAKVTLAQLLGHTSGIPSVEEQPGWRETWQKDLTPEQVLDFTRNKPLAFAPGSNFKYSNTGYILLGRVIEQASGRSYPEYVRERLFAPAAMTHSSYPGGNQPVSGRVRGYSASGKNWVNAPDFSITQAFSAGALLSTVDDMWAWEQALDSGRLAGASLIASARAEGHLPDGRGTHYGFGWEINRLGNHDVIEHGGGMPGYAAYEASVPDAGIYIVILCNTDSPTVPLHTLVAKLMRAALGENVVAPAAVAASAMEDYAGNYQIGGGANFVVLAKNNQLYGQLGPGQRPLTCIAPDEFTTPGDEWHLSFVRDAARHVQKILVRTDGPGPELVWPRAE